VEGRLQTRSWEQDGVKRYSTEIVASEMQMLDGRGGAMGGDMGDNPFGQQQAPSQRPQQAAAAPQAQPAPTNFDNFDDDIPF
ncbi:single-stranded DNA-binding protein, partial [Gammaproteobacteria bacterium]|nr:single-stranded DNA-binding protein [Gammaproteobacteria bacterium]